MFSPYPKTLQVFGAQSRGGTLDARFIKEYCPVAEFGLVGRTMHQIDECVAVEDLERLTEIYCRFIQGFFAS